MYINVFNNGGEKSIATYIEIIAIGQKEEGTIKAIFNRLKKGTLEIKLEKRNVVFKSGPKKWQFNLNSDNEVEAIKNLLETSFTMASTCDSEYGMLKIMFKY